MKPAKTAAAAAAAAAILAVGVASYASPYVALRRLTAAANARDAATVDQYVDYPALRISLKQQLSQWLRQRLDVRHDRNPLTALGALFGMAMLSPLVDVYATPDGVAAILDGIPPRAAPPAPPQPPDGTTANDDGGAPAPAHAEGAAHTAGYRGLDEFVVTYRPTGDDSPYEAIFRRDGLFSWKLSAVDLDPQPH